APVAGAYQPSVVVTDAASNATEVRVRLTVIPRELPPVQHVTALPRANAVELHWDAIQGQTVEKYRVYIGESQADFSSTLDTAKAVDSATISGLTPGKQYFFALTALQGSQESKEKSQVVSAVPLGVQLKVTPAD